MKKTLEAWKSLFREHPSFELSQLEKIMGTSLKEVDVEQLSGGMTNTTYKLTVPSGKSYVLRIPSLEKNTFLDRASESRNVTVLNRTGINVAVHLFTPEGIQLSDFFDGQPLSKLKDHPRFQEMLKKTVETLRILHRDPDIKDVFENPVDHFANCRKLLSITQENRMAAWRAQFSEEQEKRALLRMQDLEFLFMRYSVPPSSCHHDTTPDNFLVSIDESSKINVKMIDWEYAGRGDPLWDIVYLLNYGELSQAQRVQVIRDYFFGMTLDAKEIQSWVTTTEALFCWWVCVWCGAQPELETDPAYKTLLIQYRDKLFNILHSPDFQSAIKTLSLGVKSQTALKTLPRDFSLFSSREIKESIKKEGARTVTQLVTKNAF